MDPVATFREEVKRNWKGDVKGPFNVEAREKAGMTRDFYENLKGEMEWDPAPQKQTDAGQVQRETSVASVQVAYD